MHDAELKDLIRGPVFGLLRALADGDAPDDAARRFRAAAIALTPQIGPRAVEQLLEQLPKLLAAARRFAGPGQFDPDDAARFSDYLAPRDDNTLPPDIHESFSSTAAEFASASGLRLRLATDGSGLVWAHPSD